MVGNLRSRGCVEVMVQKLQDIKGQRHSFETLLLKLKREGLQKLCVVFESKYIVLLVKL